MAGFPRRGGRGFTLVEMLVLLGILAVLAAMVIPQVINTSDMEVLAAARTLACDLQYAENTAITTQQPVTVTFTPLAETYRLSYASGGLIHPITKADYTVNYATTEGMGRVDMVSANFAGTNKVTFDVTGAPDNAGSILLQAGPHVYQVDVATATGKVTVACLGS